MYSSFGAEQCILHKGKGLFFAFLDCNSQEILKCQWVIKRGVRFMLQLMYVWSRSPDSIKLGFRCTCRFKVRICWPILDRLASFTDSWPRKLLNCYIISRNGVVIYYHYNYWHSQINDKHGWGKVWLRLLEY